MRMTEDVDTGVENERIASRQNKAGSAGQSKEVENKDVSGSESDVAEESGEGSMTAEESDLE